MKDLGPIHHFLGIEVTSISDGLHLYESHYALTILEKMSIIDCKSMSTPFKTKTSGLKNDTLLDNTFYFRGIVRALQYLTLAKLDLAFSVNFTI